jgi:hypothetical protein
MMREIVYSETRGGVFEPAPTRAQKRQAKRVIEERKKKRQRIIEAVGFGLLVLLCAAIYGAELWAIKFHMH